MGKNFKFSNLLDDYTYNLVPPEIINLADELFNTQLFLTDLANNSRLEEDIKELKKQSRRFNRKLEVTPNLNLHSVRALYYIVSDVMAPEKKESQCTEKKVLDCLINKINKSLYTNVSVQKQVLHKLKNL